MTGSRPDQQKLGGHICRMLGVGNPTAAASWAGNKGQAQAHAQSLTQGDDNLGFIWLPKVVEQTNTAINMSDSQGSMS